MESSSSDSDSKMQAAELEDSPPWSSVSFACGGWLQFYMFGVAKALQVSGLDFPSSVTYCGCSAGALAAVGLALEGDFDAAVKFCKDECVPEVCAPLSSFAPMVCAHAYVSSLKFATFARRHMGMFLDYSVLAIMFQGVLTHIFCHTINKLNLGNCKSQ